MGRMLFIKNHWKKVLALGCLGGLLYAGLQLQKISQTAAFFSAAKEGVMTCFSRTHQTLTAFTLGDRKSPYFQKGFWKMTQECWAETLSSAQAASVTSLNLLNQMTKDSYGIHALFAQELDQKKSVKFGQIQNSFGRLEEKKNMFLQKVEVDQEKFLDQLSLWEKLLLSLCFLGLGALLWDFLFDERKRRRNSKLELQALKLLEEEQWEDAEAESLIKEALQVNHLTFCERLLEKDQMSMTDSLTPLKVLAKENTQTAHSDLLSYNLANMFSSVTEQLSQKLFSHGILLDFNIDEELFVKGKRDVLEQVFHNVLNHAMESCSQRRVWEEENEKEKSWRKILVRVQSVGQIVSLEVTHTGIPFEDDLTQSGLKELQQKWDEGYAPEGLKTDLKICLELIKECNGYINFRNNFTPSGSFWGTTFEILFQRAQKPQVIQESYRNISITKGRKKDLVGLLQSEPASISLPN